MEDDHEYPKYYLPNKLCSDQINELYYSDKNANFDSNVDYTVGIDFNEWEESSVTEESLKSITSVSN